jgi:hypothetical protein
MRMISAGSKGPRFAERACSETHHQIWVAVVLGKVVDGDDVRVVELGDNACLTLKARQKVGVFHKGRMHHLDGDVAIQRRVVGLVDRGHTSLAQLFDDAIRAYVFAVCEGHGCTPSKQSYALRSGVQSLIALYRLWVNKSKTVCKAGVKEGPERCPGPWSQLFVCQSRHTG